MSTLRQAFIYVLSFSLWLALPHPQALASAATADTWDEVKEDLDLLIPVRHIEHFDEVYYRIETRLGDSQKQEFAEINKKQNYKMSMLKAPTMKSTPDSLTLKEGAQELTIKVSEANGKLSIAVNGRTLTEAEAVSPLLAYNVISQIVSSEPAVGSHKSAWLLWNLLVPRAHADLSMGLIIGGVAAVALVGYLIYRNHEKKKAEAAANSCSKQAATCCNVSGSPVQLTNACCSDASGFSVGLATCPASFYNSATATQYSTTAGGLQ